MTDINLLSPAQLGPHILKNRIVMSPMTRNRAIAGTLAPGELNAEYYKQRDSAGLIITECAQVSTQGIGYILTPGIHTKEQIDGWRLITDAVHADDGIIYLQLWHAGRIAHSSFLGGLNPVAPSAIAAIGESYTFDGPKPLETPKALDKAGIGEIIEQFRHGARSAKEAGFDGVELHGASGYLLDQFTQDNANKRDDEYGGSIANRVRFPIEVTQAVADVWGSDRVGYHVTPYQDFNDMHDSTPMETFTFLVEELDKLGISYLHAVEVGTPTADDEKNVDMSTKDFLAARHKAYKRFREIFKHTIIANGGYDKRLAEAVIASGQANLVSFARKSLANPDLPKRFAKGAELNIPDLATFYGGDEKGYTDYPALDA